MFILYLVGVGLWRLFVWSLLLIYYFFVFAGLVFLAFWKALVALYRLATASQKPLEQEIEQKSLQEPAKPPRSTVVIVVGHPQDRKSAEPEDTKPEVMPEADPRYNRPKEC